MQQKKARVVSTVKVQAGEATTKATVDSAGLVGYGKDAQGERTVVKRERKKVRGREQRIDDRWIVGSTT